MVTRILSNCCILPMTVVRSDDRDKTVTDRLYESTVQRNQPHGLVHTVQLIPLTTIGGAVTLGYTSV